MFFDNILFSDDILVYDVSEGFMKGNMFPNEYKPFMNYKPSYFSVKSDRDRLLLKLYEYDFAINDLSLYLDIHDDINMYELFKKYTNDYNKLVDLYEKNYGPLELNHSSYDSYMWNDGKLPFEGGSFYV